MREFLATYFSSQAILAQIIWALVMTAAGRLWLWLFRTVPQRGELRYWVVAPFAFLLVIVASQYVGWSLASRPDLRIDFYQVGVMYPLEQPAVKPKTTEVVVVVGISNLGTPSIAEAWQLSARNSGGTYAGRPQQVPTDLRAKISENEGIVYHGTDALYEKTFQPIVTGGKMHGVLDFVFSVNRETLEQPGTVYHLTCVDVYGKEYGADYVWTGTASDALYFPGMKIEKVPLPR